MNSWNSKVYAGLVGFIFWFILLFLFVSSIRAQVYTATSDEAPFVHEGWTVSEGPSLILKNNSCQILTTDTLEFFMSGIVKGSVQKPELVSDNKIIVIDSPMWYLLYPGTWLFNDHYIDGSNDNDIKIDSVRYVTKNVVAEFDTTIVRTDSTKTYRVVWDSNQENDFAFYNAKYKSLNSPIVEMLLYEPHFYPGTNQPEGDYYMAISSVDTADNRSEETEFKWRIVNDYPVPVDTTAPQKPGGFIIIEVAKGDSVLIIGN